MHNGPRESNAKVDHMSFYKIKELFSQAHVISRSARRLKQPFFLWLTQIFEAVAMAVVAAIILFWSSLRNPAVVCGV
jgi:hypothetical protein